MLSCVALFCPCTCTCPALALPYLALLCLVLSCLDFASALFLYFVFSSVVLCRFFCVLLCRVLSPLAWCRIHFTTVDVYVPLDTMRSYTPCIYTRLEKRRVGSRTLCRQRRTRGETPHKFWGGKIIPIRSARRDGEVSLGMLGFVFMKWPTLKHV